MAVVRQVSYDDIEGVAGLYQIAGWPAPTPQGWQRLWVQNPAVDTGPALIRGWVLEDRSRIVGFMCNLAQNYRLGGRTLRAATASALIVAPDFRGETLKLVMAYAQQPHADLLLNTTAAPQTSKIFEFFKFRRIPQPDYDVSFFWVLRPARFLNATLRKKGWSRPASEIAGPLLVPALAGEALVRRRRSLESGSGRLKITVVGPDAIGPEFDDLWRRKLSETHKLFCERTSAALSWHYGPGSKVPPSRLICAWADARLVGFLAVVRRDSVHIGLTRAYIADMFVERDEPETIRELLAGAARQARADGAAMIEAVGFPEHVRAMLLASRPFSLRNESWPFLYTARDPEVQKALTDRALWQACLFDGDGSI